MRILASAVVAAALLFSASCVFAHAQPTRSNPVADASLSQSPSEVRMWFSGDIEPGFSTLVVKDSAGHPVSRANGRVDAKNRKLLESTLPAALPAGSYTVEWSVAARDGHRTAGSYRFNVR